MRTACLSLMIGLGAGCAGGNSQLATCQAEKEQLLTTIRTQRDSNKALSEQVASLEGRLDQAEKVLAQGPGTTRLSKASEPAPVKEKAPAMEKAPATGKLAGLSKSSALSWRSPDETAGPVKAGDGPANRRALTAKLADLARLNEHVRLDREAGVARIELPLAFQGETATLTADDKRRLDEMAQLLKSKEAKELKVAVSAGAEARGNDGQRTQAVVDYLDRHGIARDRLQAAKDAAGPHDAGVIVMRIVGDDAPVAGLPAAAARRR